MVRDEGPSDLGKHVHSPTTGFWSFPIASISTATHPTSHDLAIIPVAIRIVKIHVEKVVRIVPRDIGVDALAPEIHLTKTRQMRHIHPCAETGLGGVQQSNGLCLGKPVRVDLNSIS